MSTTRGRAIVVPGRSERLRLGGHFVGPKFRFWPTAAGSTVPPVSTRCCRWGSSALRKPKLLVHGERHDQGSVSNAAEPFATVAKGSLRSRSRAAGAINY